MNPWDIIGWALIFVVATPLAAGILVYTRYHLKVLIGHYRTYRTPPAEGQIWETGNATRLRISGVNENGRVGIKMSTGHGNASWSDSPEEWHSRSRRRDFRLVQR